ncbi:MAG: metal ABC transporter substrate-binding protein [Desulfobacterales bacterium]|nr:metal ABC transporter substrate-binding protein [Desulfobacterales bacterium]
MAGDRGEAALLLPPGAGVHTWQPRPGDIARLAECDLLLFIGAGLEPWLPDMLKAFPPGRVRTFEAAAGLAVAAPPEGEADEHGDEHAHGALDPHVWLDFELDVEIVGRIAEELARLDPGGRPIFAANAEALGRPAEDARRRLPRRAGRLPRPGPRPGRPRRLRLSGPPLRPGPDGPLRPQPGRPAEAEGPA